MQDGSAEQRRYPRFPAAIECTLKLRDGARKLVTANVSRHGAFLRTDEPRPERELIQIKFGTPEQPVEAMCMVVRAFPPGSPSPAGPGMGVDFFAISRDAKNTWDAFIQDAKARGYGPGVHSNGKPLDDKKVDEAVDLPDDELIELDPHDEIVEPRSPTDRENPRQRACFLVRMNDKAQLRDFLSVDISQGGMFLRTPLLRERGETVDLVIVHPDTTEEFHLGGKVVRVTDHEDHGKRGLGIRFARLTGKKLQALTDFIETGRDALEAARSPEDARFVELKHAVDRAPESASAQLDMGLYLLETGDTVGGLNSLTMAVTIAPDQVAIHEGLARGYRVLNDARRADAHGRVAAALLLSAK
jgi:Tfp pilus assembly protein PilZ